MHTPLRASCWLRPANGLSLSHANAVERRTDFVRNVESPTSQQAGRLCTAKKLTLRISSTREAEVHDDREAVLREGQLFGFQVQSELPKYSAPTFHVASTCTFVAA